jgi:putative oxidoreductase
MKNISSVNNTSNATDIGLLIARVGIAALMLTHGIPKLAMLLSGAPIQFPPVMGMSAELSLGLAVFAEVVCSLFLLAGFATRLATIPLVITMLVAVLGIHAADPFAKQEPALHYLLVYVVLLFAGSGKYSFDYLLQGKKATATSVNRKLQDSTVAIYQ